MKLFSRVNRWFEDRSAASIARNTQELSEYQKAIHHFHLGNVMGVSYLVFFGTFAVMVADTVIAFALFGSRGIIPTNVLAVTFAVSGAACFIIPPIATHLYKKRSAA